MYVMMLLMCSAAWPGVRPFFNFGFFPPINDSLEWGLLDFPEVENSLQNPEDI